MQYGRSGARAPPSPSPTTEGRAMPPEPTEPHALTAAKAERRIAARAPGVAAPALGRRPRVAA